MMEGVKVLDSAGNNVTEDAFKLISDKCPELLELQLFSKIFSPCPSAETPSPSVLNGPSSSKPVSNPESMARAFSVPYLGKLPMDLNIMKSCEAGQSFLENFPTSSASKSFRDIVDAIKYACADK